jgi:hypothetical protein
MKTCQHIALMVIVIFTGFLTPSAANAEEIGMVTGSTTGTYFRFGNEIAGAAAKEGLNIKVKSSKGSLDNILRLDSRENAAFAIVQSDVLRFLKNSQDRKMQRTAGRLRMMFPFYNEEVHLFARKEIRRIEDLQGKRVVVGAAGSGNFITASNLLHIMGIRPSEEYTHLGPPDAVRAVLMGEADAMFYVAGKPVKLFKNLETLMDDKDPNYVKLINSVHFVPLDAPRMLKEYVPSEIGPADYKWVETGAPTVAVKAVLISFDFSARSDNPYYRQRCQQLALLGKAIRDNIYGLRSSGHPKWREVNLEERVGSWELDLCSRSSVEQTMTTTDRTEEYQQKLKCTILGKCWTYGKCVTCQ